MSITVSRMARVTGDGPMVRRPPVVSAARELLGTARHDLAEATATTVATERYAAAHLAALRTAAAVLAVRTRPAATKRPRNVWSMLPQVAPELTEWAAFFAAGAEQAGGRRGRAEPGGHPAGGRRPAAGRADLPGAGRDDARAGPPAGAAAPGTASQLGPAACPGDRPACLGKPPPDLQPAHRPARPERHPRVQRSLRPPARRVRLLAAVRRVAPARAGRAGRRARHGHPGADRPRRGLRRGEVRPGRAVGRDPPGARRRPGDRAQRAAHRAADGPPLAAGEAGELPAGHDPTGPLPAGEGRRLGRPAAPAGHPARPGQGGLGGAVPAGLRDPPARGAGPAGHHPRAGRRARRPGCQRRGRQPADGEPAGCW